MALALSFMVYGLILSNFGTDSIAIRTVSQDPASAPRLIGIVIAFRLATNVPVAIGGALLAMHYGGSSVPGLMAVLAGSLVMGAISPAWLAPATEQSGVLGIYNVASPIITLLLAALFLRIGWPYGIYAFAIARVTGDFIAAVGLIGWSAATIGRIARPHFNEVLKLGLTARPIGISRVTSGLGQAADLFIVSLIVSKVDTGIYAASLRVYLLILSMSLLYSGVVFPAFGRAALGGIESVKSHLYTCLKRTVPFAVAAGLVVMALAPWLLTIVLGTQFTGSETILRLLCVSAVLNFVAVVIGTALLAIGRFRDFMQNTVISTLILVFAKATLTARFGITGAAIATSLAEGTLMILQWRSLGNIIETLPSER
jgi:O-antigen/teichoic acid export membrane protein